MSLTVVSTHQMHFIIRDPPEAVHERMHMCSWLCEIVSVHVCQCLRRKSEGCYVLSALCPRSLHRSETPDMKDVGSEAVRETGERRQTGSGKRKER